MKQTRQYGTPSNVAIALALGAENIDDVDSLDGVPDSNCEIASSAVSYDFDELDRVWSVVVVDAECTDVLKFNTG